MEDPRFPAHLGAVAVDGEVRHRRLDHHRRETVGFEALVASAVARAQEGGDRGGPLGGLLRHDQPVEHEAAVRREEHADLIPQAGLRILGIGALKVHHRAQTLDAVDLARESVKRGIGMRGHGHCEEQRGQRGVALPARTASVYWVRRRSDSAIPNYLAEGAPSYSPKHRLHRSSEASGHPQ